MKATAHHDQLYMCWLYRKNSAKSSIHKFLGLEKCAINCHDYPGLFLICTTLVALDRNPGQGYNTLLLRLVPGDLLSACPHIRFHTVTMWPFRQWRCTVKLLPLCMCAVCTILWSLV